MTEVNGEIHSLEACNYEELERLVQEGVETPDQFREYFMNRLMRTFKDIPGVDQVSLTSPKKPNKANKADKVDYEVYYHDPSLVRADFIAAAQHFKGNSLTDLRFNNPSLNTRITIQTGETIVWETYLSRASRLFFDGHPGYLAAALKKLKEICGIPLSPENDMNPIEILNEVYFHNPKLVKADFFAALEKAKGNSFDDLGITNPYKTPIFTQAGQAIDWAVYLSHASFAFFGNYNRLTDALKRLREIADK